MAMRNPFHKRLSTHSLLALGIQIFTLLERTTEKTLDLNIHRKKHIQTKEEKTKINKNKIASVLIKDKYSAGSLSHKEMCMLIYYVNIVFVYHYCVLFYKYKLWKN